MILFSEFRGKLMWIGWKRVIFSVSKYCKIVKTLGIFNWHYIDSLNNSHLAVKWPELVTLNLIRKVELTIHVPKARLANEWHVNFKCSSRDGKKSLSFSCINCKCHFKWSEGTPWISMRFEINLIYVVRKANPIFINFVLKN